jgi:hypothetical protein
MLLVAFRLFGSLFGLLRTLSFLALLVSLRHVRLFELVTAYRWLRNISVERGLGHDLPPR